jgi:hypothetical protein
MVAYFRHRRNEQMHLQQWGVYSWTQGLCD